MNKDENQLTFGQIVEYHSGKAGSNKVYKAVFLFRHERSSGTYAEIARESGRWNSSEVGHTHLIEWVKMDKIKAPKK